MSAYGRAEDAYPFGEAFYITNQEMARSLESDFSFRISYEYGFKAILEDITQWLNNLWLIIPLVAVLWLPGRFLLRLVKFEEKLDWGERTAVSIGLSISIIPIILLWTSTMGLHWTKTALLITLVMIALSFVILERNRFLQIVKSKGFISSYKIQISHLMLFGILILTLATRLAMVRDLATPAWVDSVHHATITRLILDEGAIPGSYAPYIDVNTASYHAGFHSIAAMFLGISGLDLAQGMLILGQVLNALMIFAAYLFTTILTKRKLAGIVAALLTGLLTTMPAYYTSWGRYTQLAGLLILPTAFYFIHFLLENGNYAMKEKVNRKSLLISYLLIGIVSGGLLLVHYRVAAFFGALIIVYLLVTVVQTWKLKSIKAQVTWQLKVIVGASIIAILLTIPWWPATLRTLLGPVFQIRAEIKPFADFSWNFLTSGLGEYTLGLAGLGILWAIYQKQAFAWLLLVWTVFLFSLSNLGAFSLPGAGVINNTSVTISLFLPISVFGGYLVSWVIDGWKQFIPGKWICGYYAVWIFLALTIGLLGARELLPIINPITILSRQADLPAMQWIEDNIQAEETILINPFNWGYGLYAGSDGGYWISPLARRTTLPPPVLYGLDFSGQNTITMSQQIKPVLELAGDPASLHVFLKANNINYIFIGAKGGVISPKLLLESTLFERLYDNNGAQVFLVK